MTDKAEGRGGVECPECKGSGRGGVPGMFTTNRNCSHCGGTGRVESPDEPAGMDALAEVLCDEALTITDDETPTREERHAALDEMAKATPDPEAEFVAALKELIASAEGGEAVEVSEDFDECLRLFREAWGMAQAFAAEKEARLTPDKKLSDLLDKLEHDFQCVSRLTDPDPCDCGLAQTRRAIEDHVAGLERELSEACLTLDLLNAADHRAIEKWREQCPEARELRQPDRGGMIYWCLGRIDTLERELTELRRERDDLHTVASELRRAYSKEVGMTARDFKRNA